MVVTVLVLESLRPVDQDGVGGVRDDELDAGQWTKREHKVSDWRLVRDLATEMLRNRSKDLQLAMWLTEANIKKVLPARTDNTLNTPEFDAIKARIPK